MTELTQFGAILGMELPEVVIVTIIVALIIGGHKLPALFRKIFKKGAQVKKDNAIDSVDR